MSKVALCPVQRRDRHDSVGRAVDSEDRLESRHPRALGEDARGLPPLTRQVGLEPSSQRFEPGQAVQ